MKPTTLRGDRIAFHVSWRGGGMIIEEVYDALVDAGASEDKARSAARAIASYENRFAIMQNEFTEIRGILRLHSWMLTTILALLVAIVFRVF
jgi:hypothetical protein